jgi:hypothetical protein
MQPVRSLPIQLDWPAPLPQQRGMKRRDLAWGLSPMRSCLRLPWPGLQGTTAASDLGEMGRRRGSPGCFMSFLLVERPRRSLAGNRLGPLGIRASWCPRERQACFRDSAQLAAFFSDSFAPALLDGVDCVFSGRECTWCSSKPLISIPSQAGPRRRNRAVVSTRIAACRLGPARFNFPVFNGCWESARGDVAPLPPLELGVTVASGQLEVKLKSALPCPALFLQSQGPEFVDRSQSLDNVLGDLGKYLATKK